jgi:hypothetical protein
MRNVFLAGICCIAGTLCACTENKVNENTDSEKTEEQGLPDVKIARLQLEPGEYVRWMQGPENGLKKEKIIDDMIFTVQYKPVEYIICVEERQAQLKGSLVKQRASELSDMQYYDLKITVKNGEGELLKHNLASAGQYNQRANYFAFNMQNDIQLIEGNDTLPCSLFHFERAYDITPSAVFLLGFPVTVHSSEQDKTFIIFDRIFNKGLIKFTYSINKIKNLPRLKTI